MMILGMVSAILASAFAGDLPDRPEPPELLPDDCRAPVAFVPGQVVSIDVVDLESRVVCGGQLLPTAAFLHYRNRAAWGEAVADLHAIDQAVWTYKVEDRDVRIAELEAELASSARFWERPGVNRAIGAGSMLLAVGVGILVVKAAAYDPQAAGAQ